MALPYVTPRQLGLLNKKVNSIDEKVNKVKVGEITFTQEELYRLLNNQGMVFLKDDPRLETIKTSDIVKVNNFDTSTFCYELSAINGSPLKTYVMTYITGASSLLLYVAQDEVEEEPAEDYLVQLIPFEYIDSESLSSLLDQKQYGLTQYNIVLYDSTNSSASASFKILKNDYVPISLNNIDDIENYMNNYSYTSSNNIYPCQGAVLNNGSIAAIIIGIYYDNGSLKAVGINSTGILETLSVTLDAARITSQYLNNAY